MIKLTILSLKEKIFEGEVASITLQGEQGVLTVLPSHVPLITAVQKGAIKVIGQSGDKEEYFESKEGGIFEFNNNEATILL